MREEGGRDLDDDTDNGLGMSQLSIANLSLATAASPAAVEGSGNAHERRVIPKYTADVSDMAGAPATDLQRKWHRLRDGV